jgi:hypothetical protein
MTTAQQHQDGEERSEQGNPGDVEAMDHGALFQSVARWAVYPEISPNFVRVSPLRGSARHDLWTAPIDQKKACGSSHESVGFEQVEAVRVLNP